MSGKKPWFRRKRHAIDTNVGSWQGRVFVAVAIAIELALVFGCRHYYPEWFGPKLFGWGTRPVTWQGYVVTFTPVVIFLTAGLAIYFRQKKNDE